MHPQQQGFYLDNERRELEMLLPSGAVSALDVGCGRGGFGSTLRRIYGSSARLVAIEPVPEQAAAAREGHGFDEVVEGYFPDAFVNRPEQFDLISFNDVLEHIVDPAAVLRVCADHLTPGGRVVAAIPNVGYAPVVIDLIRNRWDYTDDGVLDRTHVRFFTRDSSVRLFEEAGFVVERCAGINSIGRRWATDPLAPRRLAKQGLARALGDHRYLHFVVVGHLPGAAARPAIG